MLLQVNQTDMLPEFICAMCSNTVTEFHDFCCDVQKAQQHFLSKLVKKEHDSSDIHDFDSQAPGFSVEPMSLASSTLITFSGCQSESNIASEASETDECSMDGMIDIAKLEAEDPIEIPTSTIENNEGIVHKKGMI